jgi:hypothetical protein
MCGSRLCNCQARYARSVPTNPVRPIKSAAGQMGERSVGMRIFSSIVVTYLPTDMTWKTVRLELARTAGFPKGSVGRTYILRVPLSDDGLIDGAMLARNPSHATARRFWTPEPDQFGRIEHADGHWLLRCRGQHGESVFRMASLPILLEKEVLIEEPDGSTNPFRVASIRSNDSAATAAS